MYIVSIFDLHFYSNNKIIVIKNKILENENESRVYLW